MEGHGSGELGIVLGPCLGRGPRSGAGGAFGHVVVVVLVCVGVGSGWRQRRCDVCVDVVVVVVVGLVVRLVVLCPVEQVVEVDGGAVGLAAEPFSECEVGG